MKLLKKLKNSINKRIEAAYKKKFYKKLKNAKFDNLELLSYDIKEHPTCELYRHNDFYYNALNLKRYCSLQENYSLKCAMEHGAYEHHYYWDWDTQKNNMPVIITMGDYRKEILSKVCNKKHFAIGPYIAYSNYYLSDKELKKEKKRLGKNLLVFPMHSTHEEDMYYDAKEFCEEIKKIKQEHNFDTVRICMYWKDIINKYHHTYLDYGFECVSAGHIYDKNFIPRLKSIIETSSITMSNSFGTHLGYCIYMNKPHYIYLQDCSCSTGFEMTDKKIMSLEKLFNEYREDISPDQKREIEYYFSLSKIKTKEELRAIFDEAEQLYQKQKFDI